MNQDRTGVDRPWTLEPHVCRFCFGRIASRPAHEGRPGVREYRCCSCAAPFAVSVKSLCACGMVAKQSVRDAKGKFMAFSCGPNPLPWAVDPVEYIVNFGGKPAEFIPQARSQA